jgi:uncharacterized membrane protein YdbT with pleckstrin-like domain
MGSYLERNLGKDEHIMHCAKVSLITIVPHIFLMSIFIGFLTIIGAIIRIFSTELCFTNKKIVGKVGLISTKVMESPLDKVNNVSVEN